MKDTLAGRIESLKAGKITKSQRKILEYFETADHKHIIYMSITQLAEEVGVAEATVLRFCRSLGFNGYQEFRLNLAQSMIGGTMQEEESGIEYVGNIIADYQKALDLCRKRLTEAKLQQAFDYILSARTVCCCGVGHSYLAALELHNRLMKMGILTYCEQDIHFQNILISSRNESDLMIVFSVSGGTKDVIEAAQLARSCGMKIIVITCYERSPLTRFSDLVLSSVPMESPVQPGAMTSKLMQLFFVDVLCTGLHMCDKDRFDEFIAKGNVATARKLV